MLDMLRVVEPRTAGVVVTKVGVCVFFWCMRGCGEEGERRLLVCNLLVV